MLKHILIASVATGLAGADQGVDTNAIGARLGDK